MRRPRKPGLPAWLAIALTLVPVGPGFAQSSEPPANVVLALRSASRLWINGDSNVRSWSCEAHGLRMEVMLEDGTSEAPARVRDGTVTVPVLGLDCGSGKMNASLRHALNATAHREIRFRIHGVTLFDANEDEVAAIVRGDLRVAAATRSLEMPVIAADAGDGDLRARGSVQIRMSDFGVEPPSALFGLIRAKDEVTILFDLVLRYVDLERYLRGDL